MLPNRLHTTVEMVAVLWVVLQAAEQPEGLPRAALLWQQCS